MRRLLVVLAFCMACGPLTPPQGDAGAGGGAASTGGGVGAMGGGSVTSGGGGGGALGGGSGATGGGSDGFTWVNLSFSPVPAAPSFFRELRGLANDGRLWALLNNGALYAADAGSLVLRPVATFDVSTTSAELRDLSATDAGVLILRRGDVLRCPGACDDTSDFTLLHDFPNTEEGHALCARDGRVVLVTRNSGATKLYELNHATLVFDELSAGAPSSGERCSIDANGDIALPTSTGVLRVFAAGGFTTEPLDAGQPASWRAAAIDEGGGGLLVGGGFGVRFARRVQGAWLGLSPIATDAVMQVALPLRPGEFLGAGTFNGTGGVTVYRDDGVTLAPFSPQPSIHAQRGLARSPDEVFLGGTNSNDSDYVVLRGTRPAP